LLKQQGWVLVLAELQYFNHEKKGKEKPVFFLAVHQSTRTVALCIRGTVNPNPTAR